MAGNDWLIRKGGYFYRPNAQGYTASIQEAGRFSEVEARAHAAASSGEVTAHSADDFPIEAGELERLRAALRKIASECLEAEREENFGGPVAHLAESVRLLAENALAPESQE